MKVSKRRRKFADSEVAKAALPLKSDKVFRALDQHAERSARSLTHRPFESLVSQKKRS